MKSCIIKPISYQISKTQLGYFLCFIQTIIRLLSTIIDNGYFFLHCQHNSIPSGSTFLYKIENFRFNQSFVV